MAHNSSNVNVKPECIYRFRLSLQSAAVTALINHPTTAIEAHIHTVLYITHSHLPSIHLAAPASESSNTLRHHWLVSLISILIKSTYICLAWWSGLGYSGKTAAVRTSSGQLVEHHKANEMKWWTNRLCTLWISSTFQSSQKKGSLNDSERMTTTGGLSDYWKPGTWR